VRQQEFAEITPWRVTQGATYGDGEMWAAERAIDKDFSTGAVAIKSGDGTSWIKIELGKVYFVQKIKIYYGFYTDWYIDASNYCTKSVENFKECTDNENNVDVSVYQGDVKQKSCGTLRLTYGLKQSDQIYTLICNTEGDTVKLSKDNKRIAVYEVVIVRGTGMITD
jgi:hypothetical protein